MTPTQFPMPGQQDPAADPGAPQLPLNDPTPGAPPAASAQPSPGSAASVDKSGAWEDEISADKVVDTSQYPERPLKEAAMFPDAIFNFEDRANPDTAGADLHSDYVEDKDAHPGYQAPKYS